MVKHSRLFFIDYIRTFVVFLVVVEHVAHAYGIKAGDSWFVKDLSRGTFYDCLQLIIDTFHMPILFLLAGMFIIPSASHRGITNFMKERWIKLGIPFVFGVIFLVPPQTFFKYLQTSQDISYWEYLKNIYFKIDWYASPWFNFDYPQFTGDLFSSAFWFLAFLMGLTIIALIIWKIFPFVIRWLGVFVAWAIEHPLTGYIAISLISFFFISVSELFWGARFSLGFWKVFWVRGNLFMLYCLMFFLGIGIREAGYLAEKREWLKKLAENWHLWTVGTGALALAYCWYCLTYYDDGAFSYDILVYFFRGGKWANALPVIMEVGPLTWVRAALHAFLYTAMTISLIAIFYRFLNYENNLWISLTGASFGIYMLHEPLCAWAVYHLIDFSLPTLIKFFVASVGVYLVCWLLLDKIVLKAPFIRRVIG